MQLYCLLLHTELLHTEYDKEASSLEEVGVKQVLQRGHGTQHDHPHIAGERAAAALREVDGGVVPWFREAARDLLAEYTDPEEALARALAKVTGHTALQVCSSELL